MREQLTSERVARDPRSKINRALAAWDCDVPELLQAKHTTKGIRPMKITRKMVGAEAKARNPRARKIDKIDPFPSPLENYGPRKGLEGPFLMRNGRVVYYDPAEGAYYDPTTDFYLSAQESMALQGNPARNPAARRWLVLPRTGRSYVVGSFSTEEIAKRYIQTLNAPWNYKVQREAAPRPIRKPAPKANPDAMLYIVHRADALGKPVYDVAKFRKKAEAVQYAKAYAKANRVPVAVESKKL